MFPARLLTRLLVVASLFTYGLASAADPPLPPAPPIILDASDPPDGVPDVFAKLLPGGWIFHFDVGQSPDGRGISSFHIREFVGGWEPGELTGKGEGGGDGWTRYSVKSKPETVGFVKPTPLDGGMTGSFTFTVTSEHREHLPTSSAKFEYRFDFNWQDDTDAWYNTEFWKDGTLVPGSTHSVPEPTTSVLMIAGLSLGAWHCISRRRKGSHRQLIALTQR